MCIIIHKPAGVQLAQSESAILDLLKRARYQNSDGFGIQAWRGKELVCNWRGLDAKKIDEIALANFSEQGLEVVGHWRWATHGHVITDNCHPFPINQNLSFFHNGVLSQFGAADKSDTLDFVEQVARPLIGYRRHDLHPHHEGVLEKWAGARQRFAVASRTLGKVWRFGSWVEEAGVWFSNFNLTRVEQYYYYDGGYAMDERRWYDYRRGSKSARAISDAEWERMWLEEHRDRYVEDDGVDDDPDMTWDSSLQCYVPADSSVRKDSRAAIFDDGTDEELRQELERLGPLDVALECECFGDVCGQSNHDNNGGCNARAIVEVRIALNDGKHFKTHYAVRACVVCAYRAVEDSIIADDYELAAIQLLPGMQAQYGSVFSMLQNKLIEVKHARQALAAKQMQARLLAAGFAVNEPATPDVAGNVAIDVAKEFINDLRGTQQQQQRALTTVGLPSIHIGSEPQPDGACTTAATVGSRELIIFPERA